MRSEVTLEKFIVIEIFYSLVHRTPSFCTVVADSPWPSGDTRVRTVAAGASCLTNFPLLPYLLVSPAPHVDPELGTSASRLFCLLKINLSHLLLSQRTTNHKW